MWKNELGKRCQKMPRRREMVEWMTRFLPWEKSTRSRKKNCDASPARGRREELNLSNKKYSSPFFCHSFCAHSSGGRVWDAKKIPSNMWASFFFQHNTRRPTTCFASQHTQSVVTGPNTMQWQRDVRRYHDSDLRTIGGRAMCGALCSVC